MPGLLWMFHKHLLSPKRTAFQINFVVVVFLVYILWVRLSSFIHTALFSLVRFVLSVFRLFVYKPMRLTMPVCVLSCAYCCRCASVPPLASTRCKVETMTTNRVACICAGLTLWPFLLPLTPPPRDL